MKQFNAVIETLIHQLSLEDTTCNPVSVTGSYGIYSLVTEQLDIEVLLKIDNLPRKYEVNSKYYLHELIEWDKLYDLEMSISISERKGYRQNNK